MPINPLIALQGQGSRLLPQIGAAAGNVARGVRDFDKNKRLRGMEDRVEKIKEAALISQQLLPALNSGDMNQAEQILASAEDSQLGQEGMRLLRQDPRKLKQIAQRAIDVNNSIRSQTGKNIVGSPQKLDNGNLGYLTKTGEIVDTGQRFYEDRQIIDVGGVPHVFDRRSEKLVPADVGGRGVTARDVAESKATIVGEEEAAKGAAKETEQRVGDIITSGLEAAKGIPTLRRSIGLLDQVGTGGIQNVALRAKQIFGVEGADEGELSANLGQAVLGDLRETFGAQFTEKEGERLERIRANFGKSPATNKRLLRQSLQIAEQAAERAKKAAIEREDFTTAQEIKDLMGFEFQFDGGQPQGGQSQGQPGGFKVLRIRDQ